jgi:iron complex outermembrane receptor protein
MALPQHDPRFPSPRSSALLLPGTALLWVVALWSPLALGADEVAQEGTTPTSTSGAAKADLEVLVAAPANSASAVHLERDRLHTFPGRSTDDLLRAVPGLHTSAHGGRGKAYQYFLRGFDAVHGADLSVRLHGMPLNEVSNAHGHGYLDLAFIPSELVYRLEASPGVHGPLQGDFGLAGSADLTLGSATPGTVLELGAGTEPSVLLGLRWTPETASPRNSGTFAWAQIDQGAGVGEARGWRQARAGAAWASRPFQSMQGNLLLLAYQGEFESPGVIRAEQLESGGMGAYEAYTPAGFGASRRLVLIANGEAQLGESRFFALLWGGLRDLSLVQNFTGWQQRPILGDSTTQISQTGSLGARVFGRKTYYERIEVQVGGETRGDWVEGQLAWGRGEPSPHETIEALRTIPFEVAGFGGLRIVPDPRIAAELYLRGGLFHTQVQRTYFGGQELDQTEVVVARTPFVLPRSQIRWQVLPGSTLFASYGRGLRSPTAFAMRESGRAPLTTSEGADLGIEQHLGKSRVHMSGFGTWISNELLFDHTAARFLSAGATRRIGADAGLEIPIGRWFRSQADLTFTDGRTLSDGALLPYVPRYLAGLGLYYARPLDQWRLNGGLRGWFLAPRPLPQGLWSAPTGTLDLTLHAEGPSNAKGHAWLLDLDASNLLFRPYIDGEFVFASDWERGGSTTALPTRHLTIGNPTTMHLVVGRRF